MSTIKPSGKKKDNLQSKSNKDLFYGKQESFYFNLNKAHIAVWSRFYGKQAITTEQ